jgi:hypothetical protein
MAKKTTKAHKFPATTKALSQELPQAPAAETGKATKTTKKAKPKKMSALDAAAKLLGETGTAMTTNEMIEGMSKRGYWSSPNGATPAATLYSALLREINAKGKQSRFAKTERGKFGLKQ